MSEGFEKLKSLGAQKIHEKTHIAKHHVQALLHESFDEMTKVQFVGFVSILQREYGLDLTDLKDKGLAHFTSLAIIDEEESQVFIAPKRKKNNNFLYVLLALVLLISAIVYSNLNDEKSLDEQNATYEELQEEQKEKTELAKENNFSVTTSIDKNASLENNGSKQEPKQDLAVVQSLEITPHARLWIGFIDMQTQKKQQTTIEDTYTFDAQKEWLLYLGHGNIEITLHGEKTRYKQAGNMRFHYKDGILKKLDLKEFKSLNKGDRW